MEHKPGHGKELSPKEMTQQLIDEPFLLSDLLHAFDRGDETYFLYLNHKVEEIGRWVGRSRLRFGGKYETSTASNEVRTQEAEPWQPDDHESPWADYRNARQTELDNSRKAHEQHQGQHDDPNRLKSSVRAFEALHGAVWTE
jgi:hypothetical protein